MHVVGIEGGVCSGKSTLSEQLARLLPESLLVPEFMDIEPLPLLKLTSLTVPQRIKHFFRLESQRHAMLCANGNAKTAILDRTFLSICAFEYANFRLERSNGFDLIPSIIETSQANIIFPSLIIYLNIENETRLSRARARNWTPLKLLLEDEFNSYLKHFFIVCSQFVECRIIDNSTIFTEQVIAQLDIIVNERNNISSIKKPDLKNFWRELGL